MNYMYFMACPLDLW